MTHRSIDDLDLAGARVLVRVDLNVPMSDGKVSDDTRIRAIVPTLRDLLDRGATPILAAHFGRPKGAHVPSLSLAPLAAPLAELLGAPVAFAEDCIGLPVATALGNLPVGAVLLLENTRFHPGEEANDPDFARALAAPATHYVNDAFSAAHRAHASTEGVAHLLPAAAGRLMQAELTALEKALAAPERPLVAVVGGAKISTKLDLLANLIRKVDVLAIGGGMANTFLAAERVDVGRSLAEHAMAETAVDILKAAEGAGCRILLPVDIVAATAFEAHAPHEILPVTRCPAEAMILDAGPQTVAALGRAFEGAKTVIWNGPLGAFELPPFDQATVAAARKVAELTQAGQLLSVAGGGDTVAALNAAGAAEGFSYVSTAGGAFLEWLEGKPLPGVAALAVA